MDMFKIFTDIVDGYAYVVSAFFQKMMFTSDGIVIGVGYIVISLSIFYLIIKFILGRA